MKKNFLSIAFIGNQLFRIHVGNVGVSLLDIAVFCRLHGIGQGAGGGIIGGNIRTGIKIEDQINIALAERAEHILRGVAADFDSHIGILLPIFFDDRKKDRFYPGIVRTYPYNTGVQGLHSLDLFFGGKNCAAGRLYLIVQHCSFRRQLDPPLVAGEQQAAEIIFQILNSF